jgi:hypothetical protein
MRIQDEETNNIGGTKMTTREEQIEVATAAYINGRLRSNVPPEEIEEIRLAYQAGAIYADENPDLYSVTRKEG